MYPLIVNQQQCQRSLCLHPVRELLLSCFYRASFWLRQFLWRHCTLIAFAPCSLGTPGVKCLGEIYKWECRLEVFARTSSKIWRIARIYDVLGRFPRKPFWFFPRIFSISDLLYPNIHIHMGIYVYIYVYNILFTNPSARAGYDTRSIFKRSLTGLNSEFSFS